MARDRAYLLDIREASRLAISYVGNASKDVFLQDTQLQDSVIRRIEIIGEAARRISPEFRSLFPALPWSEMIGMRDLMIHDYDDVDLEIVWNTVQRDLPRLLAQIESIMGSGC